MGEDINKGRVDSEKAQRISNIKISIIWILLIFSLALVGVFISYMFYRQSINPNPIQQEKEEIAKDNVQEENTYALYIQEDEDAFSTQSVFDTDLKIKEALNKVDKKIDESGKLELTEELQNSYKAEILSALYLKQFNKAIDYVDEVIKNYDISNANLDIYNAFLYEVKEMDGFEDWSFENKKSYFKKLISPELILFMYLSFTNEQQYQITTNKNSAMIFDNPVYNIRLSYKGGLKAGLYTEVRIDEAYFVAPPRIDGYKIKFDLNEVNYVLYYIRYQDTGDIEVVYVECKNKNEVTSFKDIYNNED